jgi:hypothetical protein
MSGVNFLAPFCRAISPACVGASILNFLALAPFKTFTGAVDLDKVEPARA